MKNLFSLALAATLPLSTLALTTLALSSTALSAQEAPVAREGSVAQEDDPGPAAPGAPDTATSEAAMAADTPVILVPTLEVIDGYDVDLESYRWTHRPVVVFADSPADPQFQEQMDELMQDVPALITRDVVVLVDTRPQEASALRKKLRPRGFMLVLVGKDGGVKLRKPLPWSVRELTRTIDKIPTRLREVEERRGG